ncbi:PREDICTED: F-box/LRR-repeat protein At3g48880-like [Fragaria vesca subsp. vesca]|uniref:F-box/LRR-repeat protein At3g48880-like n=1 Tax=Fragaria vesca subsp. vesca TaxID=101020 RepID=UPI0002C360D1|nr:PREDICTED: F-box/LRR-repeat protein At3g48880-like [Fragaria vesca subsp. vesca]
MEEGDSLLTLRRWDDLNSDILRKIFGSFDYISDATSAIAQVRCSAVCIAWRSILCDPQLWDVLDLSWLKSNFIKIHQEPYVYVDSRSDETLSRVLKVSLSLSRGNITTLVLNPELYISDDQLTFTAERCPNLKRLVMPTGDRIKKTGICQAIRNWQELESLTVPGIMYPPYLMEVISNHCSNFRELKIMGRFDVRFASTLVGTYLPNLKVMSLRCSQLVREALITILDGLPQLEVLNIAHCVLLIEPPRRNQPLQIVEELDEVILEKASRLERFITCTQIDRCIMCQRARNDGGIMKWYKYEEGLWKQDEVNTLAL